MATMVITALSVILIKAPVTPQNKLDFSEDLTADLQSWREDDIVAHFRIPIPIPIHEI
jgi:hypothetical protein